MGSDPMKLPLAASVLEAAKQRIAWTFDAFSKVYLSGPSGKDSGVMMHLVCQEARRRGRKVGVLYLDPTSTRADKTPNSEGQSAPELASHLTA